MDRRPQPFILDSLNTLQWATDPDAPPLGVPGLTRTAVYQRARNT